MRSAIINSIIAGHLDDTYIDTLVPSTNGVNDHYNKLFTKIIRPYISPSITEHPTN